MKLLIMKFLQPLIFSSHFGPVVLPSTLFSNTHNLCSSFNVRDQVSHPYKTRVKIIVKIFGERVLYIKCVLVFSTTSVRNIFWGDKYLANYARDECRNAFRSSCSVPLLLSDFN
jgi:hypothetical protein